ncbi:MAG: protoheme IX farnesyltransferase, partial [Gammaproteobacteria bacterium]
VVTALPVLVGMSGWIYGIGASILGLRFLYWAIVLLYRETPQVAMSTFRFSIIYLLLLFVLLLVDHYVNWGHSL